LTVKIIEIPKVKMNFEETVKDFFEKCGYRVERGVKWSKRKVEDHTGVPDFYVSSPNESFFIEVKDNSDGLSITQIRWIMNHPEEKVFLAIPSTSPSKYWRKETPILFETADLQSITNLYVKKKKLLREIADLENYRKVLKKKIEKLTEALDTEAKRKAKNMDDYLDFWRFQEF